jgi:hypothetical protein
VDGGRVRQSPDFDAGNGQEKGNPLAVALLCKDESEEIRRFSGQNSASDPPAAGVTGSSELGARN